MKKDIKEKKLLAFERKATASFRAVARKVFKHRLKAKEEYPRRDRASLDKRYKFLVRLLDSDPQVAQFMDQFIGDKEANPKSKKRRRETVKIFASYLLNRVTLKDASTLFYPIAQESFSVVELSKRQNKVKSTFPAEIQAFLPKSIVIDTDKNKYITNINDLFVNEKYDLSEKIKVQRKLILKYNTIVKKIKKDLKSPDEITKLAALITSIIMETGIRPGKIGNHTIRVMEDKEVEVETFGAVSLNSEHVRFIREDFAVLNFVGKKGGTNIANIRDRHVLSILQGYIDNAFTRGSKYIFTTSSGEQFDYKHLSAYFNKNFKGFKVTDLRKLKATRAVFDSLQEEKDALYARIREIAEPEVEKLKQLVIQEVVETINLAHEKAQAALSHMDSSTTQDAYINPQVLLRFLSTAKVESPFRDYVLKGKTKLEFDPLMFVREAEKMRPSKKASAWMKPKRLRKRHFPSHLVGVQH
jgi:hypothetical protein